MWLKLDDNSFINTEHVSALKMFNDKAELIIDGKSMIIKTDVEFVVKSILEDRKHEQQARY